MTGRAVAAKAKASVFVNCPYDDAYLPLLRAALFTIHDCGFVARTALEDVGSGETRLDKIVRILSSCRLSIHDVTLVTSPDGSSMPRFNMPFDCGLAFGMKRFGSTARRQHDLLLLAAEPFEDKRTLSDLSGQDAQYHRNDRDLLVQALRKFLAAQAADLLPAEVAVRGGRSIIARLAKFERVVPRLAGRVNIDEREILTFDDLNDWLALAVRWQSATR